jgi:hypothetical protein
VGWKDYAVSDFHVALPERWEAVDVDEEGIQALWDALEGVNTEWAQNITKLYSAEAAQKAMKFWARDTKLAGLGYATAVVTSEPRLIPIDIEDYCTLLPPVYKQMGLEMIESKCGLEINGLDAARFLIRVRMGTISMKQYQYIYVQETKSWALSLGVDATKWSEYEPIFVTAGESFRVD